LGARRDRVAARSANSEGPGHGRRARCSHAVVKGSAVVNVDGDVQVLELLETSRTNAPGAQHLYDRRVASCSRPGRALIPDQACPSGRTERAGVSEAYSRCRARLGDVDLAAVWVIPARRGSRRTPDCRRKENKRPSELFTHLDRLVRA